MKNKKIFLIMAAMLFLLPLVSVNAETDEDLFEPFRLFLNYDLNLDSNVKEYNLSVDNDISRIGLYNGLYNSDENLAFADKFPNTIFLNCLFKIVENMEVSPALLSSNIKLNGVEILNSDFSFKDDRLPLYELFADLWLKDLPFADYYDLDLEDLDEECSEEGVCTYSKDGKVIAETIEKDGVTADIEYKYYDENGKLRFEEFHNDSTGGAAGIEYKYYDENGKLRFEEFHNDSTGGAYVYDENGNIQALDLVDTTDVASYYSNSAVAGILGNLNVGNNELKIEFGDADDPEYLEFLVNINRKAADSKIDKDLTATPNTGSAFVIAIIVICLLSIGVGIYYYQKMKKSESKK